MTCPKRGAYFAKLPGNGEAPPGSIGRPVQTWRCFAGSDRFKHICRAAAALLDEAGWTGRSQGEDDRCVWGGVDGEQEEAKPVIQGEVSGYGCIMVYI